MNGNGDKNSYFFGEFEVDPGRRVLLRSGVDVKLKPKTVDVLLALIERHGEVVSKGDLLDRAWDGQFVEEKNLSVHIAALRKIFGETKNENRFIATVPGTGYSFVADVSKLDHSMNGNASHAVQTSTETGDGRITKKVLAVGAVLIVVGSLLAFALWRKSPAPVSSLGSPSIKQLTTNGRVRSVAISPDGKLFAYTVDENGKRELYSGFTSGGKHSVIVEPTDAEISEPAFSPDSNFVFFGLSGAGRDPAIYRASAGSGPVEKVLDGISSFKLSPDGKFIYFGRRSDANDAIIAKDLPGGSERELATFPKEFEANLSTVSLSPDGQSIAIAVRHEETPFKWDVMIASLSTPGEFRRIPNKLFREIGFMKWADPETILVCGEPEGSLSSVPHRQVYRLDVKTGEPELVTGDLSTYDSSLSSDSSGRSIVSVELRQMNNIAVAPVDNLSNFRMITNGSFGRYDGLWGMDFTPDGKIMFTSSDSSSQVISVMDPDGSNVKQLTAAGHVNSALSVTPDGRFVVFLSYRGETAEIWRMNSDGSNSIQLTHAERAYQPFISADGRWVYYVNASPSMEGRLQRVPIDGGDAQTMTEKRASWGAASPDGKFIATGYEGKLAIFETSTFAIVNKFDLPQNAKVYMGVHWTPDSSEILYRDEVEGYWAQNVSGGPPRKVDGLPAEKLYNFSYSKDGKYFAFVRGVEIRDAVMIAWPTAK
ncbi:MAG: hypothetical protein DMF63_14170 [Acidobacteria bacterium]|nr:MAG: hypothetical protein DMF63_14170 [Acidobacteriota bacterium]